VTGATGSFGRLPPDTSSSPRRPSTDEVAKILGRPTRTLAEWAADHAAAFRG
jgi:hypothetical protein